MYNAWIIAGGILVFLSVACDGLALSLTWLEVYPDKRITLRGGDPFFDVLSYETAAMREKDPLTNRKIIGMIVEATEHVSIVDEGFKAVKSGVSGFFNSILGRTTTTTTPASTDDALNPIKLVISDMKLKNEMAFVLLSLLAMVSNNLVAGYFFTMSLFLTVCSLASLFASTCSSIPTLVTTALMTTFGAASFASCSCRFFGIVLFGVAFTPFYATGLGPKCAIAALLCHMAGAYAARLGLPLIRVAPEKQKVRQTGTMALDGFVEAEVGRCYFVQGVEKTNGGQKTNAGQKITARDEQAETAGNFARSDKPAQAGGYVARRGEQAGGGRDWRRRDADWVYSARSFVPEARRDEQAEGTDWYIGPGEKQAQAGNWYIGPGEKQAEASRGYHARRGEQTGVGRNYRKRYDDQVPAEARRDKQAEASNWYIESGSEQAGVGRRYTRRYDDQVDAGRSFLPAEARRDEQADASNWYIGPGSEQAGVRRSYMRRDDQVDIRRSFLPERSDAIVSRLSNRTAKTRRSFEERDA